MFQPIVTTIFPSMDGNIFKRIVDGLVMLARGYMQLIYLAAAIGAGIIIFKDVFLVPPHATDTQPAQPPARAGGTSR